MTTDVIGAKYKSGRDIKEIAKEIRTELKREFPSSKLRFSVRISRFSMGQSIDVDLIDKGSMTIYSEFVLKHCSKNLQEGRGINDPEYWEVPEWIGKNWGYANERYSRAWVNAMKSIDNIVSAHKRDSSDPQTDYSNVNFYGHVGIDGKYREVVLQLEAAEHCDLEASQTKEKEPMTTTKKIVALENAMHILDVAMDSMADGAHPTTVETVRYAKTVLSAEKERLSA